MSGINLTLIETRKRILQKNWAAIQKGSKDFVYQLLQSANLPGDYALKPGTPQKGSSAKKGVQIKDSVRKTKGTITLLIQPGGNDTCRFWTLSFPAHLKSDFFRREIEQAIIKTGLQSKAPAKKGRTMTLKEGVEKPESDKHEKPTNEISDLVVQASLLKQQAGEYASALEKKDVLTQQFAESVIARRAHEEKVRDLQAQLKQAEDLQLYAMAQEEAAEKKLEKIDIILSDPKYRAAHDELNQLKKLLG